VVDQPRAGVGVVEQLVDNRREGRHRGRRSGRSRGDRLPYREEPGPQRPHGDEVLVPRRPARDDVMGVEEHLQGTGVGQRLGGCSAARRGVHQVGREHESGRRVMSEKQLDS